MSDEDKKATEQQVENVAEKDTQKTTEIQAVDSGKKTADDVKKVESNPYAKELAALKEREAQLKQQAEDAEAALKKKDEIIEHKNRALESEKKKAEKATTESVEDLKKELLGEVKRQLQESDVLKKIALVTTDSAEQELIRKCYDTAIVKTGNFEEDLQNAVAVANRKVVWEQKQNRAIEEQREDFLTSFKGLDSKSNVESITSNPIQRAAEEMVRSINPEAVKFVKEQFKS